MNLSKYIQCQIIPLLKENISGQELIDNFRKVFPYSEKDNGVLNYHTDKYSTEDNISQDDEKPSSEHDLNRFNDDSDEDGNVQDLEVKNIQIKKEGENVLHGIGYVQSGKEEHGKHRVEVRIKREDTSKPFSIKDDCQVYCDCNAFRYRVAYPLFQKNALDKNQTKPNNKIPNKIQNPNKIPTICKHCYSFLIHLYNKHELRN